MYKAGLYIRVSVLECKYENECQSAENQFKILNDYLKNNTDITIYNTYFDLGKSGMTSQRDGLKNMLSDIYSGLINCVLVKDVSRLGRNYTQTGNLIEKVFPFWGVRFISVNDNYDSEKNFKYNNCLMGLKNILNEGYVRDISKKEKTALRVLMKEGQFLGSLAPYGYIKNGKKLEIDCEAAHVVRRIFEMAKTNVSCYKIAKTLNEEKVLTPYAYKISKGIVKEKEFQSFFWRESGIKRILKNRAYIGDMVQSVTTTLAPKGKNIRLPKEKWIVVENTHKAIISRKDFELVQNILSQNSKKISIPINRGDRTDFNIYCGMCGFKMSLKSIKSGSRKTGYYICSAKSSGGVCQNTGIKSSVLDKTASKVFKTYCLLLLGETNYNTSELKHKVKCAKRYTVLKKANLYEKLKSNKIKQNDFDIKSKELSLREKKSNEKQKYILNTEKMLLNNSNVLLKAFTERITVLGKNEIEIKMRFINPFNF